MGYTFTSGYGILLLCFGMCQPFTRSSWHSPTRRLRRLRQLREGGKDYRFLPALEHVAVYLLVWLVILVVLVVLLAVIVHAVRGAGSGTRPGSPTTCRVPWPAPRACCCGCSSSTRVSPVALILRLSATTASSTWSSRQPAVVFALIAFWTGAGGWILVMYGALNNIRQEVMEAARIDGAGPSERPGRSSSRCSASGSRTWSMLSLAAGTQLFVEPRLLSQASKASCPRTTR